MEEGKINVEKEIQNEWSTEHKVMKANKKHDKEREKQRERESKQQQFNGMVETRGEYIWYTDIYIYIYVCATNERTVKWTKDH